MQCRVTLTLVPSRIISIPPQSRALRQGGAETRMRRLTLAFRSRPLGDIIITHEIGGASAATTNPIRTLQQSQINCRISRSAGRIIVVFWHAPLVGFCAIACTLPPEFLWRRSRFYFGLFHDQIAYEIPSVRVYYWHTIERVTSIAWPSSFSVGHHAWRACLTSAQQSAAIRRSATRR